MAKWRAYAEYEDGSTIEKFFPCTARNYLEEEEEQYKYECYLLEGDRPMATFYTVDYISDDMEFYYN
jgi:hypothetical protein